MMIGLELACPSAVQQAGCKDVHDFMPWASECASNLNKFIHAIVNRFGGPTVGFSGVSAQLGYILTSEHRPYNARAGVLGRVIPENNLGKSGCGAWAIAGRWSMLDLNDTDIRGGRLNTSTLGLNWYLNKFTKFQFNYVHAFLDHPANADSNAESSRHRHRWTSDRGGTLVAM